MCVATINYWDNLEASVSKPLLVVPVKQLDCKIDFMVEIVHTTHYSPGLSFVLFLWLSGCKQIV